VIVILLLIGLVAGVLSGLFGVGGGILIVPALVVMAKFQTKVALGTSLGALLLPVGLLGAYTYYQHGNLNVRASVTIGVGLFFGAWAGAQVAHLMPSEILQRLFAVIMAVAAIWLWQSSGP
jgi:uncharacterized membrane protein YfcA